MSLTVILPRTAEPNVIHLTQEQIQRELSQVNGSELLVTDSWGEGISKCRTEFITFLEPDCEVSSGYFSSMIGLFKKNPHYRQLGMMGSATGVVNWATKIYGYSLAAKQSDGVIPNKKAKSSKPYLIQIVYVPGAVIRYSMLKRVLGEGFKFESYEQDLVYFSTMLSLEFWRQRGHITINPNSTYVTTEAYVGDIGNFPPGGGDLVTMFGNRYI